MISFPVNDRQENACGLGQRQQTFDFIEQQIERKVNNRGVETPLPSVLAS
jgi:hypothetical protein